MRPISANLRDFVAVISTLQFRVYMCGWYQQNGEHVLFHPVMVSDWLKLKITTIWRVKTSVIMHNLCYNVCAHAQGSRFAHLRISDNRFIPECIWPRMCIETSGGPHGARLADESEIHWNFRCRSHQNLLPRIKKCDGKCHKRPMDTICGSL